MGIVGIILGYLQGIKLNGMLEFHNADAAQLHLSVEDPKAFAKYLQVNEFPEWAQYEETFRTQVSAHLEEFSHEAKWWVYWCIDTEKKELVAIGGFQGPPEDGKVSLSYEVAEAFKGTVDLAIASKLESMAWSMSEVMAISAFSLSEEHSSLKVLPSLGFERIAAHELEPGTVWEWEKRRS